MKDRTYAAKIKGNLSKIFFYMSQQCMRQVGRLPAFSFSFSEESTVMLHLVLDHPDYGAPFNGHLLLTGT
jgi:3'-phosphoadenosine 5'-phosphosulfate sulfotransferase (PAPS reductase)/FAD synthetase